MPKRTVRFLVRGLLLGWTSLCVLQAGEAAAEALSKPEQKCVKKNNKSLAKMAKVQGKEHTACLKKAAKGKLATTIEACLTADAKGKVAKARAKTTKQVPKACAASPDFGIVDPTGATASQVAIESVLALIHSIFGPDLDAAVVEKAADPAGQKCQKTVAKLAQKCQDAKLKAFNACKKTALKGKRGPAVANAQELQDTCLGSGLNPLPDPKGKAQKACVKKLSKAIGKKCAGQNTATLFPGCADEALGTCVDRVASCEVCLALNAVDGLARDCEALDDGMVNGSCVEPEAACTPGETEPCYTGPPGTLNVGPCTAGTRTCAATGSWGSCSGEVTPGLESCAGLDDDCDGLTDADDPDCCTPGSTQACSTGLEGICAAGTQTCNPQGTGFGACQQQLLPTTELCNGLDDNCNGETDEGCP
jgi:hypothetical protein